MTVSNKFSKLLVQLSSKGMAIISHYFNIWFKRPKECWLTNSARSKPGSYSKELKLTNNQKDINSFDSLQHIILIMPVYRLNSIYHFSLISKTRVSSLITTNALAVRESLSKIWLFQIVTHVLRLLKDCIIKRDLIRTIWEKIFVLFLIVEVELLWSVLIDKKI